MKALLRALWLAAGLAAGATAAESNRPNVLIILADDLGYGDVQCYNPDRGRIPTPHIDRLASQGMRFTDAHTSSSVCSPSRYALLTGRYHWRTRLQTGIVNVFGEPLIAPNRLTIASLAQRHGYRTAAIGKWHLGWDWPATAEQRAALVFPRPGGAGGEPRRATPGQQAVWREVFAQRIPGGPTTRGFDSYFGTDVPNWPPFCFIENDRTLGVPSEFLPPENFQNLLASLPGPALPGWKLEEILPALGERAARFLREAAAQPQPYLLYLPLTAPHTPLAVTAPWRGRSGLNPYADFVMETDALVGRVLAALDQSGAAERTLVVFTSDNGCTPIVGPEELQRKGHFPSGPFRGYKFDAWEGGHRVPLIVRWPGVVPPASVCDQLAHQADLLATLAAILGQPLPADAGEDSFSLLPLLRGGKEPVRTQAVSCAANGIPALRQGSWKYIAGYGDAPAPAAARVSRVRLHDLAVDPGETRNLADDQPERVAALQALLEKIIADGRSTPGAAQPNDVPVRRFPAAAAGAPKARPAKK